MKTMTMTALLCGALLAMGGCGSTSTGTDAGPGGGSDGGSGSPDSGSSSTSVLEVNFATGLHSFDKPLAGEGAGLTGTVQVHLSDSSEDLPDAVLKVNDVTVPINSTGLYEVSEVSIPAVAAGGSIKVSATWKGQLASLTVKCPPEVTLTAPTANTAFATGDTVALSWTGSLGVVSAISGPTASVLSYNSVTRQAGSAPGVTLKVTDTSVSIKAPTLRGSDNGFIAELATAGDYLADTKSHGFGLCYLHRRVILTSK